MIALNLQPLPKPMQEKLIANCQVSQYVSTLLSEKISNVPDAVAFVTDNANALKILVETDLNLAMKLISDAKMAIGLLSEQVGPLKRDLQENTKRHLSKVGLQHALCRDSALEDLIAAGSAHSALGLLQGSFV